MATLRNKRKTAIVSRETQEHSRNSQSQNTSVPGTTDENIAQASEKMEGRVTKKLFQEFSRTESRILGALSKLDDSLLNPQVRTLSGTVPEHTGTMTRITRNQLGIVPRVIPIPKWSSLPVRPAIYLILTRKRPLTDIYHFSRQIKCSYRLSKSCQTRKYQHHKNIQLTKQLGTFSFPPNTLPNFDLN